MAIRRNISYINKDFTELRASLVDYARTYFPTTYNDFSAVPVAPITEPVTLAEAKLYCRVTTSAEDTLITLMITM